MRASRWCDDRRLTHAPERHVPTSIEGGVSPGSKYWANLMSQWTSRLELSAMSFESLIATYFTKEEAELLIAADEDGPLRERQLENAGEYHELLASRQFRDVKDCLETKLTMLTLGMPVEPIQLPFQATKSASEVRKPQDALFDVPPPLHFLHDHTHRYYGRDGLRGVASIHPPLSVPQDSGEGISMTANGDCLVNTLWVPSKDTHHSEAQLSSNHHSTHRQTFARGRLRGGSSTVQGDVPGNSNESVPPTIMPKEAPLTPTAQKIPLYGYQGVVPFDPSQPSSFIFAARLLLSVRVTNTVRYTLVHYKRDSKKMFTCIDDELTSKIDGPAIQYIQKHLPGSGPWTTVSCCAFFIKLQHDKTPLSWEPGPRDDLVKAVRSVTSETSTEVVRTAYIGLPVNDMNMWLSDWGANMYSPYIQTALEVLLGRPYRGLAHALHRLVPEPATEGSDWGQMYGLATISPFQLHQLDREENNNVVRLDAVALGGEDIAFFLPNFWPNGNEGPDLIMTAAADAGGTPRRLQYHGAAKRIRTIAYGYFKSECRDLEGIHLFSGEDLLGPEARQPMRSFFLPFDGNGPNTEADLDIYLAGEAAQRRRYFLLHPKWKKNSVEMIAQWKNSEDPAAQSSILIPPFHNDQDNTFASLETFFKNLDELCRISGRKNAGDDINDGKLVRLTPKLTGPVPPRADYTPVHMPCFYVHRDMTKTEWLAVRARITTTVVHVQILGPEIQSWTLNMSPSMIWGPRYGRMAKVPHARAVYESIDRDIFWVGDAHTAHVSNEVPTVPTNPALPFGSVFPQTTAPAQPPGPRISPKPPSRVSPSHHASPGQGVSSAVSAPQTPVQHTEASPKTLQPEISPAKPSSSPAQASASKRVSPVAQTTATEPTSSPPVSVPVVSPSISVPVSPAAETDASQQNSPAEAPALPSERPQKKPYAAREEAYLAQPSAYEDFEQGASPRLPLNAPPLESFIRPGPDSPMVNRTLLTLSEQADLQKTLNSLRLLLTKRLLACPYPGCSFQCKYQDTEDFCQHIDDEHSKQLEREVCPWCKVSDFGLLNRKEKLKHIGDKHKDALLQALTGGKSSIKITHHGNTWTIPLSSINAEIIVAEAVEGQEAADSARAPTLAPAEQFIPVAAKESPFCNACGRDMRSFMCQFEKGYHRRWCADNTPNTAHALNGAHCHFCEECGEFIWSSVRDAKRSGRSPEGLVRSCEHARASGFDECLFCWKCGIPYEKLTIHEKLNHMRHCEGYGIQPGQFCGWCGMEFVVGRCTPQEQAMHKGSCSARFLGSRAGLELETLNPDQIEVDAQLLDEMDTDPARGIMASSTPKQALHAQGKDNNKQGHSEPDDEGDQPQEAETEEEEEENEQPKQPSRMTRSASAKPKASTSSGVKKKQALTQAELHSKRSEAAKKAAATRARNKAAREAEAEKTRKAGRRKPSTESKEVVASTKRAASPGLEPSSKRQRTAIKEEPEAVTGVRRSTRSTKGRRGRE
ncbi:hypothetical protein B0I35DRAFT_475585 [Stachybotrys elegans]|uniref:Uncharacterized protein n=1 Tax=Stachybotrys elegans TaxID=80388 RepID=A0A8K0WTN5_9HYPO|nr:hypothetical protein B0I35DRAFT_475585 [Stachybotrys elegans]